MSKDVTDVENNDVDDVNSHIDVIKKANVEVTLAKVLYKYTFHKNI